MIVKIGNKFIGENQPVFIIAEAGVNHNGSLAMAKKLVDAAKAAGADAIKFQTFKSEDLVTQGAGMAKYQEKNTGKKESQLSMLKKLELKNQDFIALKKYCDKKNIMFLSTAHTKDAVDFLNPLMPAFKIASGDLTNVPFLQAVAKNKKPMIVSTGMADMKEIQEAVATIIKAGNQKIIVLHCTTNYPCPLKEVNLKAMITLKKKFGLPVGYSDHTEGIWVSVMAAAMGATALEKHFTLDKSLPGPDHKASLEPKGLQEMVDKVREVEKILGSGIKKPTASEKNIALVARKSIVAKKDILKGQKVTGNMLTVKRPGSGIEPKYLNKIIGKYAKEDIKKESLVKWNQVS